MHTRMDGKFRNKATPFMAVIFLQFGFAGLSVIVKFALNKGMSPPVLVVYRHAIATLVIAPFAFLFDRKVRPKMTLSIFFKIALLGLLEPTIDQNLYYTGMKYTTATFASAMANVLPAFAFLMAWIFRLESIKIRSLHSQAKILGTVVTVGGAMLMTLIKGPMLDLPWTNLINYHQESTSSVIKQDPVKGALLIATGCISWAAFIILQAITLKAYPAELSLSALICLMGTLEGTIAALAIEGVNPAVWSIHMDTELLAAVYSGVICSGIGYYVQGVIVKKKGPVFVTAFSPLSMVIVAIIGSFVLAEIMYLGRVLGAIVIVIGLYLVLWGKSKDQEEASQDLDSDKASLPTCINNIQDMSVLGSGTNKIAISDQESLNLDVTQVRLNNESV